MSGMLDKAVAFRTTRLELADRWFDVKYANLVADPLSVVRSLYE